ncbi:hypothetical protein [Devosia sp. FJ2-5-3]|uniref:hypothetical protein n=1 Tax=Devosia sp. FJ2-5-3 TaxID=2976680 RepID=UPI0023D8BA07|nr:hypothetical protein [Devosia sp. FJ2-5-3]WEJ60242.1 hypothetical protein N0P34_09470 [Devosia sp. FJ2-5-3]
MSSAVLSPDNDYNWPPEPSPARLTRQEWDSFGTSVGMRLRALEAVGTGIEAIQEQLQSLGLQILDNAINPLIAATQAQLADLQQAVADTIAQNAQIITDFQGDTTAALAALDATIAASVAALQADVDAVRDQVDAILAGGIPAANVAEDVTHQFVTEAQKAEIGQLRTDLGALSETVSGFSTSLADGLAAIKAGGAEVVTSNTNAVAGGVYFAKTAGGAFAVTLPPSPANGNTVEVWRSGANAVTINRNGKTIGGLAENFTIDQDKVIALLTFMDGGWTVEGRAFVK